MQSPNLAGLSAAPVRSPSRRTVKSGRLVPARSRGSSAPGFWPLARAKQKANAEFSGFSMGCASSPCNRGRSVGAAVRQAGLLRALR